MPRFNFANEFDEDSEEYGSAFEKRKKNKTPDPYKRIDPKRQKRDNYSEQRKLKRGEHNDE